MSFSVMEVWQHMGVAALVVAAVLLVMGLASATVFVERLIALRRSRAAAGLFTNEAQEDLETGLLESVQQTAEKYPRGHLPQLVKASVASFIEARTHHDTSGLSPLERTRRRTERHLEQLGADMRRGLSILASVGSVAPFVGLLGTVVGIISAFQGIASTGSGGLSSVSAGISEALVETALGLAVAIPAVLAFNYLSTQIGHEELKLDTFSGELLDLIETVNEREAATEVRHERVA